MSAIDDILMCNIKSYRESFIAEMKKNPLKVYRGNDFLRCTGKSKRIQEIAERLNVPIAVPYHRSDPSRKSFSSLMNSIPEHSLDRVILVDELTEDQTRSLVLVGYHLLGGVVQSNSLNMGNESFEFLF